MAWSPPTGSTLSSATVEVKCGHRTLGGGGDDQIAAMFKRTAWILAAACAENVNRACGSCNLSRATL